MKKEETTRTPSQSAKWTKNFESPFFWLVCIFVLFAIPLIRSFTQPEVKQPAILSELGDFELTDQNNKKVSKETYKGSVLVVNFIFTSCPDTCPLLTQQMAKIQSRLMGVGSAVHLLSISVDPDTDTPAVLKRYGDKHKADYKNWSFLTGPLEHIQDVVVKGFKVGFEKGTNPQNVNLFEITHGEHFVIVDQLGRIRSYNHAANTKDINEILKTVAILANTKIL